MSGDAQLRKRKDKRKKKEDSVEEEFFTPLKHSTDEVIHVQKDIVCGGNVVTKLIFFGLLATIGIMVGFILLEYRGSTDEETTSAVDSPWSVAFHDWIDQVADTGHDHEDGHVIEEHGHEEHEHVIEEHGHDDHEEHGHDSHEEPVHQYEESETGKGINWILGWIKFGTGSEEEAVENEVTEEADEGIFGWFQLSQKEQNKEEIEEKKSGGGWFGFGGGHHEDVEEGEEQEEDKSLEEIDNEEEEDNGQSAARSDEDVGEEDENISEVGHVNDNESKELNHEMEDDEEENGSRDDEDEEENKSKDDEDEEENGSRDDEDEEENESRDDENEEENESKGVNDEDEEENESKGLNDEDESKDANSEEDIENESKEGNDEDEFEEDTEFRNVNDEEEEKELEFEQQKEAPSHLFDDSKEQFEDNDIIEDFKDRNEEETDSLLNEASEEAEQISVQHGVKLDEQKFSGEIQEDIPPIYEEMFPEAIEALQREAEEEIQTRELKEEEPTKKVEQETDLDSANESVNNDTEETEGTSGDEAIRSTSNLETTEVPLKGHEPTIEEPVVTAAPIKTETAPLPPPPPVTYSKITVEETTVEEESADEGSPVDEGSPGDEEEDEDLEIDRQKFRDLLAKYGQESPESSDIEQSDDDIHRVDYSEGEESPVGGEEVAEDVVGSEDEAGSEDDLKEWTGIKKSDIQVETDSEVEEEVEEEESEDEPPPPPPPQPNRKKGGQRDINEDYGNIFVTNDEDWAIREELDQADEELNYETARTLYRALLVKHPNSPRARYGLAQTFDRQAEKERSNAMLDLAILGYKDALEAPNITDILYIQVASRLIDRLRFRGQHLNAVPIHYLLIQKFNTTPEYRTDLAITYLMINRLEDARLVLKELLRHWSQDPIALAHYGLVLKLQGNIHGCIKYFEEGLQTAYKPPSDPRLYFHFGDALARVGRNSDALKVYDSAVALGLFRSRYQRSLYNVDRLTARPWWTHQETTYASFFKMLEDNWERIRDEGVGALKLNGMFKDEAEGLRDKGSWKQFELFARGSKNNKNCEKTPFTCSLIGSFDPAATCKRGQSKFSIMDAGTHVWPHCGPTNCRLRAHLGLIVPSGPMIRVANITRTWEEGKVMIFDDSFEHEVWHEGSSLRLVLIVDVWHPELTEKEKISLSPI